MNSTECLQELGKTVGLDLDFDHTGRCTLLIDGEHEICFEKDGDGLILHCSIMPSEMFSVEDFQHVLMASYIGSQTDRAAFSINPQSQNLTLWRAIPSLEDGSTLAQYAKDFLSQVRYWKEELSAHRGQSQEGAVVQEQLPMEAQGETSQYNIGALANENLLFFRV